MRRRALAKETSTPMSSKDSSWGLGRERGRMEKGVGVGDVELSQRREVGVTV